MDDNAALAESFQGQRVRLIIEDKPYPNPKHKDGIISKVTSRHLLFNTQGKLIALLLDNIRRIEPITMENKMERGRNGKQQFAEAVI